MLKRKRQNREDSPRTFVFAYSRSGFEHWCHKEGLPPHGKDVYYISTHSYHKGATSLRGFKFSPRDKIVVLEMASFGHGWAEARRDALLRSEGWVDIGERRERWL